MKNKKILFIDVNCKSGSTGKIVYDLYNEVNKSGNIAAIAYGRGTKIKEKNIFKFGIDIETKFHVLMNRITGIHGSFSFLSTIRLKRFIKSFNPDVIHIHELHGYFVNIVSIIKFIKKLNIKVIWTFHCEYMYTGKGNVYTYEENPTWNKKKDYPRSLFFDKSQFLVKRYKKTFHDFNNLIIVCPSNWLKNRVEKSFLSDKNIIVINNGIDQKIFNKKKNYNKKSNWDLEVISVAPNIFSEHKGGKYILKLAKMKDFENVKFTIVGADNYKFETENVEIILRTENQLDLACLYSNSDLFIITSIRENYPTTCIEAISCGTPIIGFDVGGVKETTMNKYGKFVKYGDVKELSILLKSIISKKELVKDRMIFTDTYNYSKDKMMKSYLKYYKEENE